MRLRVAVIVGLLVTAVLSPLIALRDAAVAFYESITDEDWGWRRMAASFRENRLITPREWSRRWMDE